MNNECDYYEGTENIVIHIKDINRLDRIMALYLFGKFYQL